MTTRTLHTLGLLVVLALALGGCSTNPETQKRDYLAKGDKYFDKGSFREASIMYQKALQKDMRFGQAYYKLGLSQLKLGRVGEGASALRRAVELQPDNVDAHGKLADVYLGAYMTDPRKFKNLSTELSDIAQKLIKKDANSYQGLRIEAYLALAQGKLKEAIEQFRHADKAKPLESDLTLALSQALLADGQQEEGESLVRKLLAKDDTYGPAYDVLYLNFMRAKRLDEAEKVLSDKVAKNPKSAQFVVR